MAKKKKEYKPGYMPRDAVAWCDYHDRGMNYEYIRRKHCLFNKQRKQCKHLQWFGLQREEV